MGGAVDEAALRDAVQARKSYILDNLETVSLKVCRKTLEQDMGLEPGELKPYKKLLTSLIDNLLKKAGLSAAAEEPAPASIKKQQSAQKSGKKQKAAKPADSDGGADEEEADEQEEEEEEEEAPRKRRKQEAKQSGPRQYSARIEKLRGICKAATITIPPSLYSRNKGDEGALRKALEALLEKNGLEPDAGEREISRARVRLQQQRDLDGIETSNILEGGRRRRAAAVPVSYNAMIEVPSDSEEEAGEEASEGESGSDGEASEGVAGGSGSEAEAEGDEEAAPAPKAKAKQQQAKGKGKAAPAAAKRKAKAAGSGSEEEEASEEEWSEGEAGQSDDEEEEEAPAAANKSPDENHAVRGNGGSAGKAGKAGAAQQARPAAAAKPKARPAASMEDSEDDSMGGQPAGKVKRRAVVAQWSDDD